MENVDVNTVFSNRLLVLQSMCVFHSHCIDGMDESWKI